MPKISPPRLSSLLLGLLAPLTVLASVGSASEVTESWGTTVGVCGYLLYSSYLVINPLPSGTVRGGGES